MKKIILYTLLALVLSACNSTSSDTKESIALTAPCNTTDDTTNYQVLQSGDIVSKPETLHNDATSNEPEIEIIHTEDGMKKVCLKSGTAVILR